MEGNFDGGNEIWWIVFQTAFGKIKFGKSHKHHKLYNCFTNDTSHAVLTQYIL